MDILARSAGFARSFLCLMFRYPIDMETFLTNGPNDMGGLEKKSEAHIHEKNISWKQFQSEKNSFLKLLPRPLS